MPPSDEEMIRHFATYETAFRKVYGLISEGTEGSYHYPPSRPDTADSVSLRIFEEIHGTPYKPFELHGRIHCTCTDCRRPPRRNLIPCWA